jgi:hypothetical protein
MKKMHRIVIKTGLLLVILACVFCKKPNASPKTSQSQGLEESSQMQTFLAKRFPNAQEVYWDTLENGFSATFYDGKNDYKAIFDSVGHFQNTTMLIELEALPASINKLLKEKYKDTEVAIVQLIDNDAFKTYHVELQSTTDYLILDFDTSGKLLKETKDPLSSEELKRQEEEGVEDNQ